MLKPSARVNVIDSNKQNTVNYTVTLFREDGTAYTIDARSGEEAYQIKENWESGRHKLINE